MRDPEAYAARRLTLGIRSLRSAVAYTGDGGEGFYIRQCVLESFDFTRDVHCANLSLSAGAVGFALQVE